MNDQHIEWATGQLEHQITAAGTLADSHPDQLVPTCDPWTMRDLTEHFLQLAAVWHAAVHTPSGGTLEPGKASATAPDVAEVGQRTAQLHHAFAPLAQSFRELSPTTGSWWFEVVDWTVADLLRRTLVETAVHLWDAQNAVSDPQPLNGDVAALSLQDDRRLWIPRQARGAQPPAQWVRLDTPTGPTTGWWHGPAPEGEPAAVVDTAAASQLCLSRWGRHDPQEIDISGNADVVHQWISFFHT